MKTGPSAEALGGPGRSAGAHGKMGWITQRTRTERHPTHTQHTPRGQGGARQAQVHPRRLCQMERVNTGWEGLRCWVAVWHRAASTFLSHLRQFHSNPPALVSSTSAAFLSIQVFGWLAQKNFSSLEQLRGTGLTPTVLEGRTFNPYLPGAFSYSSKSVYLKPQSSKSD